MTAGSRGGAVSQGIVKTGNIYRKLDELNDTEGAAQRARIGLDLDKAKADDGQPPELVDALGLDPAYHPSVRDPARLGSTRAKPATRPTAQLSVL